MVPASNPSAEEVEESGSLGLTGQLVLTWRVAGQEETLSQSDGF